MMSNQLSYQQKLDAEAELWGAEAERMAQAMPPNWHYHHRLHHNIIMRGADIEELLSQVHPGMSVLELGCASGWPTLAMAQGGANAVGLDISDKLLDVARRYYERIREEVGESLRPSPTPTTRNINARFKITRFPLRQHAAGVGKHLGQRLG